MAPSRRQFNRRCGVVLMALVAGLVAVGARSAQLQIYQHDQLSTLALGQYLTDLQIPARRGHIYDRHNEHLAISIDVPSVFADPRALNDPRDAARQLSRVLDVSVDTLYRRLASDKMFVWLKRRVTPEVERTIRDLAVPGVDITMESKRFYPHKEVASQVLGFVGVDAKGLEGIEFALDDVLVGEPQVVSTLHDARGVAVLKGALDPEHRSTGADVYLTLDLQIQHAAEVALERAVETSHAASGIALVLDVPTAEILAVAVRPTYNPNKAGTAAAQRRRNRALTDMFDPGSSLKPIVVAAALDAGAVTLEEKIFCENGAFTIGRHTIGDSAPRGWLTVGRIVQVSSNPGAAKVGLALGKERLAGYLKAFGFGERTGVRFPGETPGILHPAKRWSHFELATISFGQGISVGALQLAAAYRVLAAGGVYRQPTLVRRIDHPQRRLDTVREPAQHRVISTEVAASVTAMMELAAGPEGTGFRGQVRGFRVAGKTGTAQKADPVAGGYSHDRFVAVFGGFLPADDPRVVIVVAIDEPQGRHSGGAVAGPVFAEIGEHAMRQLGLIPSGEMINAALMRAEAAALDRDQSEGMMVASEVARAPATVAVDVQGRRGIVPSFAGLTARQAMERYVDAGLGVDFKIAGSGRVVSQQPAAGTPGEQVQAVRLTLALQ